METILHQLAFTQGGRAYYFYLTPHYFCFSKNKLTDEGESKISLEGIKNKFELKSQLIIEWVEGSRFFSLNSGGEEQGFHAPSAEAALEVISMIRTQFEKNMAQQAEVPLTSKIWNASKSFIPAYFALIAIIFFSGEMLWGQEQSFMLSLGIYLLSSVVVAGGLFFGYRQWMDIRKLTHFELSGLRKSIEV
ncbi:hypothetical protein [Persicobacter diffluens]|uniref:Uncharacterized protein n=1 Tax=Persicobacter diffluens TaxID=981 RepID=A0AAN5AMW6_9BACT|nr:hypothetical protein PEDI_28300 [Persicobacter diffluens]